jgi:hypothetical protein
MESASTRYNVTYYPSDIDAKLQRDDLKNSGLDKIFELEVSRYVCINTKDLFQWFADKTDSYEVVSTRTTLFRKDDLVLDLTTDWNLNADRWDVLKAGSLTLNAFGPLEKVEKAIEDYIKFVKPFVTEPAQFTTWIHFDEKQNLSSTQMPIKKLPSFHPEMYPYLPDLDGYIDNFRHSKANILVMTSEPGTGKSNLINYILKRTGWGSTVCYDSEVMGKDGLYLNFLKGASDVLILEDADLMLQGRLEAGNRTMSKILNISDGIVEGKKFIFTANINSASDLDQALMRPGRCYDILWLRSLTRDEAGVAAAKIGRKLKGNKKEYTVAEIYNGKIASNVVEFKKIGFA